MTRCLPNWSLYLPDVLLAFPNAAPSELLASRGDLRVIKAHIAFTHDLTLKEAAEMLEDVLDRALRLRAACEARARYAA